MDKIKKSLQDNKFPDCQINCICVDKTEIVFGHMAILSISSYFDNLFKWTEAVSDKVEKRFVNTYNIKLEFNGQSLLTCIDLLYNKEVKPEVDLDLLYGLAFLDLDINYIKKIMVSFVESIIKMEDYTDLCKVIFGICESPLDKSIKQNFLTRVLCLLQESDKCDLLEKFPDCVPQHIFSNFTGVKDNILTLCGSEVDENDPKYIYNDIRYLAYSTFRYEENETGFWISGDPDTASGTDQPEIQRKAKVSLLVTDGVFTKKRNIVKFFSARKGDNTVIFPCEIDVLSYRGNRKRYGEIFDHVFYDGMVFEFTVEFVD